jgi:hypothetical protein
MQHDISNQRDGSSSGGAPVIGDILKCQLRPIALSDYAVSFTPTQVLRLASIFPSGVCDYSKPGLKQRTIQGTWLDYTQ